MRRRVGGGTALALKCSAKQRDFEDKSYTGKYRAKTSTSATTVERVVGSMTSRTSKGAPNV